MLDLSMADRRLWGGQRTGGFPLANDRIAPQVAIPHLIGSHALSTGYGDGQATNEFSSEAPAVGSRSKRGGRFLGGHLDRSG